LPRLSRPLRHETPDAGMITALRKLSQRERINFLLTNRVPRKALTHLVGWWSRIESPLLTRASIAVWGLFTDLDLSDAKSERFTSLRACFTRELLPGARAVDPRPDVVTSPCDAIVGEVGDVAGTTVFQAKGFPYELEELIPEQRLRRDFTNGRYVTLRLKSSMYHRFHAPVDCATEEIHYISGDLWNVNPIALKRVEGLFCRNERAVVPLEPTSTTGRICLVPVAAILVASMKFTGIEEAHGLHQRGPRRIPCNLSFRKGDEMGYFQQGSTIILFATANYALYADIESGTTIRMGQALLADTTFKA
jgi:phosphatidylserine decarboxylase